MKLQFISGLPRSGSTLLAAILRQNPRFHASIMSPVGRIVTDAVTAMGPDNEANMMLDDAQRRRVLHGIFDAVYAGNRPVVFDNNRRWCANASLLADLYSESKIICCVRPAAAIVDSFERLFRKHMIKPSVIYGGVANLTVFDRTTAIMRNDGVVGFALNALRDAFFGPNRAQLHVIEYDNLCRFPAQEMERLHTAIQQPQFKYDFTNIEPIPRAAEFDEAVSTPGLHDLKPRIVYEPRSTILPPEIVRSLPQPFWRVKKEATPPG